MSRETSKTKYYVLWSAKIFETQLLVVEGEAGTGKSSLLWALRDRIENELRADAWLVDASELQAVFGTGRDGIVLSPENTMP